MCSICDSVGRNLHAGDDGLGVGYLNAGERGQGTVAGKTSYSIERAATELARSDAGWGAGATVSYGFRSTAPGTMPTDTAGFTRFNATQIAAAEAALQSWSDVANITFVRQGAGDSGEAAYSNSATILFANYASGQDGASAFAYYPGSTAVESVSGDAWFRSNAGTNLTPTLGNSGYATLVHEIGHALGLDHPGDYSAGEGNPSYAASAPYHEDSTQYSVMSYWSEASTGARYWGYRPGVPMLDDIAAIQLLYGANMSTRTGDTTYGVNSNTGRNAYTAVWSQHALAFAVWDAGGYDTLDFSGYFADQTIDLRQGSFSNVGGASGNVAIALGAVIERAIGGLSTDTMYAMAVEAADPLPDISKPQTTSNTSMATAILLDGAFDLAFEVNVPLSTSLPHATVQAVASGGHEYYSFSVSQAGATGLFDIDGIAAADGFLRLYNAAGQQLASDDDFARDPGSTIRQDPFIGYTFSSPGVHYIAVERFENVPGEGTSLPAGTAYTLNVSLSSAPTSGALTGSQLEGRMGHDTLIGNVASDILYGGLGNDILRDGGGGEDVRDFLFGGEGNDTYYVTSGLSGPIDLVFEGGTDPEIVGGLSDVDTIVSQGSFFWDFYSVAEALRIDNAAGSQMVGGQINQSIFGDDGNDLILAYGGSNIVDPGAGTDATSFSLFDLAESFDGTNTLVMKPGSGLDYVFDFESGVDRIDLTAFNFGITGAQVLAQAVNVDQVGTANDYCFYYLTSAGGVDNFVAFIGLLSSQLQAADFVTGFG